MGKKRETKERWNLNRHRENTLKPYRKKYDFRKRRYISTAFIIIFAVAFSIVSIYIQKKQSEENIQIAEVVRVVDGDTLILFIDGKEERVRLIGVNCPESVSGNTEENSVYGKRAAEYTRIHLGSGKEVYISYDVEKEDIYGRKLVYLWTDENMEDLNNLFQKQLTEAGYAFAVTYEPNVLYSTELFLSMKSAYDERKGLWDDDVFYAENQYMIY